MSPPSIGLRISRQPPFAGLPREGPTGFKKESYAMKKSAKIRLTLHRETLRNLSPEQMNAAQGGAIVRQTDTCFCPVVVTNQSCPTNCGQWYCYGV